MPRGPRKHLKRINAPKHWMLDKMTGVFAPRPSSGPHKLRECLPLIILLRNRLKYALNAREVKKILVQRTIKVDHKIRTDSTYPAGFMDVVSIDRTNENFRLLYNVKGKFVLHRIKPEEAKYKLCKVRNYAVGPKGVPYITTHDGRTIRYPHPTIRANDSIKLNLETQKVEDIVKFGPGCLVMVTGGRSTGRIGILKEVEKHPGSHHIVYVEDLAGRPLTTRLSNVFALGLERKALVSLPRGGGIKLGIVEAREKQNQIAAATIATGAGATATTH